MSCFCDVPMKELDCIRSGSTFPGFDITGDAEKSGDGYRLASAKAVFTLDPAGEPALVREDGDGLEIVEDEWPWKISIKPILSFPLPAGTYFFSLVTIGHNGEHDESQPLIIKVRPSLL